MAAKKLNPLGIKAGDRVRRPVSGRPDRFGDDSVWEVLEVQDWGGCTLHLVGAPEGTRCGSLTRALRPVADA
jgi:hypothetical protein